MGDWGWEERFLRLRAPEQRASSALAAVSAFRSSSMLFQASGEILECTVRPVIDLRSGGFVAFLGDWEPLSESGGWAFVSESVGWAFVSKSDDRVSPVVLGGWEEVPV